MLLRTATTRMRRKLGDVDLRAAKSLCAAHVPASAQLTRTGRDAVSLKVAPNVRRVGLENFAFHTAVAVDASIQDVRRVRVTDFFALRTEEASGVGSRVATRAPWEALIGARHTAVVDGASRPDARDRHNLEPTFASATEEAERARLTIALG